MPHNQSFRSNTALTSNSRVNVPNKPLFLFLPAAIILATLGFMFVESPANSGRKVGYVNSATILNLLPAAQHVQSQLDTLVQDWSDTINQMSKDYQTKVNDFERQSDLMTPEAKQRAQAQIADFQQRIVAYRQDRVGQGGELDRIRAQLLKPIQAKILMAVAQIARKHGMKYVLDNNKQIAVLLFADRRYDLTYEVLDLLTRETSH